jgi:hypothetical protein
MTKHYPNRGVGDNASINVRLIHPSWRPESGVRGKDATATTLCNVATE